MRWSTCLGSENLLDPKHKFISSGAILGAEFGTSVRATLFAASEDLSKIRGAMWSAGTALDKLEALLQEDIDVLALYR